jgi:signal peptidase I
MPSSSAGGRLRIGASSCAAKIPASGHGLPVINGWRVPHCILGTVTAKLDSFEGAEVADYELVVEFLEGKAYLVALERTRDDGRQGPYQVRPGEYWVLGDNRNNSADSRSWNAGRGGGVPLENTRGQARWLWFPAPRLGVDLAGLPALPPSVQQLAPELNRCLAGAPNAAQTTPPPAPADRH